MNGNPTLFGAFKELKFRESELETQAKIDRKEKFATMALMRDYDAMQLRDYRKWLERETKKRRKTKPQRKVRG